VVPRLNSAEHVESRGIGAEASKNETEDLPQRNAAGERGNASLSASFSDDESSPRQSRKWTKELGTI